MKGKTITVEETTLMLNQEETAWLKGLMQNPISCEPHEESKEEKEMRLSFWSALGGSLPREII